MVKMMSTRGTCFTDSEGHAIIPHGINMVCKDRARGHLGDYRDQDFEWLKAQGFNIVRLGIYWAAAEPQPGVYDEDYFAGLDEIITRASRQGIAVFLDMHQDLYAEQFEDGAPDWATVTNGAEHVRTELWSESYLLSDAVQTAFDSFWDNAPAADGVGIMDHYIALWRHIAERYADHPYVVGYDIMNEPFPGSRAKEIMGALLGTIAELKPEIGDPMEALCDEQKKYELFSSLDDVSMLEQILSAVEPVTADYEEHTLNPFYDRVARAIREVDRKSFIMLESNYFANAGIPSHLRPAVDERGEVIPHQVYAPHGYDIFVDTDMYSGDDTTRIDLIFASLGATAEQLGLPVLVGEWGCFPDADEAQLKSAAHLRELFKAMGAGDTYFDFSHIYGNRIIEVLRE